MRSLKEKVQKKRIRPSASVLILMAVAGTILSPMLLLPVNAAPGDNRQGTPRGGGGSPPDPDCWGEVVSTLTQADDGSPGIGEHSSDPVPSVPGRETPRDGVGNQDEGTPSEHGATVSAIDGNDETECEPDQNDP
jgi:hypothetical protein